MSQSNFRQLIIASIANFSITMASAASFTLCPMIMDGFGAKPSDIGQVESIVESLSLVLRVISGYVSDLLKNRKIFLIISYIIGLTGKYMLPYASSIDMVFMSRVADRIGNGLAASPRDALIGSLANTNNIGLFFGIRLFFQYGGSLVCALLIYYLYVLGISTTSIIWITSIIPSILAIIFIIFLSEPNHSEKKHISIRNGIYALKKEYLYVLFIIFMFKIGYYSGAFYYKICISHGMSQSSVSLPMLVQNAATCLCVLQFGYYSDRCSRRNMFIGGTFILLISHLLLYLNISLTISLIGIALYGIQIGITHNLLSAMIVNTSNKEYLGLNFGIANIVMAMSVLLSNKIIGTYDIDGFQILIVPALLTIILSFFYHEK